MTSPRNRLRGRRRKSTDIIQQMTLAESPLSAVSNAFVSLDGPLGLVPVRGAADKLSAILKMLQQEAEKKAASAILRRDAQPNVSEPHLEPPAELAAKMWDIGQICPQEDIFEIEAVLLANEQVVNALTLHLGEHLLITQVLQNRAQILRSEAADSLRTANAKGAKFVNRLIAAGVASDHFHNISAARLAKVVAFLQGQNEDLVSTSEPVDGNSSDVLDVNNGGNQVPIALEELSSMVPIHLAHEAEFRLQTEPDLRPSPQDIVPLPQATAEGVAPAVTAIPGRELTVLERLNLNAYNYKIVRRKPQNDEDRDALKMVIPPTRFRSYWDLVEGDPDREAIAREAKMDFRKAYKLFVHWAKVHGQQLTYYDSRLWFIMLYLGQPDVNFPLEEEKEFHGMLMPVADGSGDVIQLICTLPDATARFEMFTIIDE